MFTEFKAKRSLGQNFLINPQILDRIVAAAEINSNDIVLEIGPGTGNLTEKLIKRAGTVIAVEKDRRLIDDLKNKFTGTEIIEEDVLRLNLKDYTRFNLVNYKVVGNIPYYITSYLLRTIFEEWPKPELIVLTIQKEVAQRIVAKPPEMSLLALSVQLYSDPKIISYVSKNNFKPQPKVDSAIIKLKPKQGAGSIEQGTIDRVLALAKKAFAGKRKQLKNTLPEIDFEKLGIKKESRPEELFLDQWIRISKQVL